MCTIEEVMGDSNQEESTKGFDTLRCIMFICLSITLILGFFIPVFFIILPLEGITFYIIIIINCYHTGKKEKEILRKQFKIEEYKGSGVKGDPLVIESCEEFFKYYRSNSESNRYIIVRQAEFPHEEGEFVLELYQNITFEECSFVFLSLFSCSNVNIKDCVFKKGVYVHQCQGIIFEDCDKGHLDLYCCYICLFKDILLRTLSIKYCRGNTFERVKPDWYVTYEKINPPIHISKRKSKLVKDMKSEQKNLDSNKYDKKYILQYPPNKII